ncbi:MAG: PTS sugar transporter subunit IIA [Bacilli bacterium]
MEYIDKEYIIINNDLTTKEQVLQAICQLGYNHQIISSEQEVYDSFMAREALGSTGFGFNLAIPHALDKAVLTPKVIIVKSNIDIEWQALDNQPVNLIIALLVPAYKVDNVHIKLLSKISRSLVKADFIKAIKEANNEEALYNLFKDVINSEDTSS